jgi:acetyl esterase
VPINSFLVERLPLLDGMTNFDDVFADPELRVRLDAFMAAEPGYEPPPVDVVDAEIEARHGRIRIRTYRPRESATAVRTCLVWMHGGGFVVGDLDMPEANVVAGELSNRAGAVVVSVDYHLAVGGVHYPIPHDDVVDAWRWAIGSADELGIDPERVFLGGASAGANLATGAALRLRDDGDVPAAAGLLLAYPVFHAVLPPPSEELAQKMTEIPVVLRFPPEARKTITENYLGGPIEDVPIYAMPGEAELAGLPPVWIVTSEYDDLRASAEAFAPRLRDAGVSLQMRTEEGVFHGHLNHGPSLKPVANSLDFFAGALQRR